MESLIQFPNRSPKFERLLPAHEAAVLLGGIHVKTLQRKAREGVIPGRQIGRSWFFRASELDAWVASFAMIGTANSSAA
jgi:excisionase family DNA binding protein